MFKRHRRYTFRVPKDDLHFEITVRAPDERAASDKAATIGFKLGLLLVGPD